MKMIGLLFIAMLSCLALPSFAASSSFANRTASMVHSAWNATQDTAITTYLYAKLASNPDLSSSKLDISTNSGRVTLNGLVDYESQVKEIRQIAENTSGVKSVDASKIMISQQESALFVKNAPVLEISENTNTLAQPKMQPSTADPLLLQPRPVAKSSTPPQKPKAHRALSHKKKRKQPPKIQTSALKRRTVLSVKHPTKRTRRLFAKNHHSVKTADNGLLFKP